MDPLDAAQALIDAIGQSDVRTCLADDVHFRSDVHGVLDGEGIHRLLQERIQGHRRLVVGDRVMKRNLVFIWWRLDGIDGTEEQGTWIISFDRDGKAVEWQEFRG